jgi:hypothetical protein
MCLGHKLPYDSFVRLCAPRLSSRPIRISRASTRSRRAIPRTSRARVRGGTPEKQAPFRSPVADFYLTNPVPVRPPSWRNAPAGARRTR